MRWFIVNESIMRKNYNHPIIQSKYFFSEFSIFLPIEISHLPSDSAIIHFWLYKWVWSNLFQGSSKSIPWVVFQSSLLQHHKILRDLVSISHLPVTTTNMSMSKLFCLSKDSLKNILLQQWDVQVNNKVIPTISINFYGFDQRLPL